MDIPEEAFRHEALRDASTQLRLLKSRPASECHKDSSCYTLRVYSVDKAPRYQAISYSWGELSGNCSICIDGRHFNVSQNCWYALTQATCLDSQEHIWIDQICIDQRNSTEKSTQVRLMGSIYTKANIVLASLGPHDGDSGSIFRWCVEFDNYMRAAAQDPEYEGVHAHSSDVYGTVVNAKSLRIFDWCRAQSMEPINRRITALYSLSRRPYFSRLWIIQELLLAQNVTLVCGDNTVAFDDFIALYHALHEY